jgi:phenylpyruvate tautomerase PptA (4-oxalocrotonate tautomerase family)
MAERITTVIAEEAGTNREGVTISFVEVSSADYASGGVLVLDRQKK